MKDKYYTVQGDLDRTYMVTEDDPDSPYAVWIHVDSNSANTDSIVGVHGHPYNPVHDFRTAKKLMDQLKKETR